MENQTQLIGDFGIPGKPRFTANTKKAEERMKSMQAIYDDLYKLPDKYDVLVNPTGQLLLEVVDTVKQLITAESKPSATLREDRISQSGIAIPAKLELPIMRKFEYNGKELVRITSYSGARPYVLSKSGTKESPNRWVKKYLDDKQPQLQEVTADKVGIQAISVDGRKTFTGAYYIEAGGTMALVLLDDTAIERTRNMRAQMEADFRFAAATDHYDEQGRFVATYVDHGFPFARSTSKDRLVYVQYKSSKDEAIGSITFNDGQSFRSYRNDSFTIHSNVGGYNKTLGTIANPNFSFDEFGNLTYTADNGDRVTKMLHGPTIYRPHK